MCRLGGNHARHLRNDEGLDHGNPFGGGCPDYLGRFEPHRGIEEADPDCIRHVAPEVF